MIRHIQIAINLLFFCLPIACLAGPPYNVDDPSTTELKHFNLIAAYQSNRSRAGELQAFPNFTLAYGLTSKVELNLGLGAVSSRATGAGRIAGFGDTLASIKWRFLEETKHTPQIAMSYQIKIPTADVHRGLGSGTVDNTLWLSTAKSFGRTSLFGNVGYNLLGGSSGKNNLLYGAGVTFQATETVVVGADVYGNSPNAPGANDELAWGVGLQWSFRPDKAFLLHLGRSERGFSDLNVYAGFAFTFK
jgi:hypothetical protein